MFLLEKARQLFEPFDTFLGIGNAPGRSHQVQRLWLLFLGQFIEHVPHLVIAATLYRLIRAKHFFNGCPQSFRPIDDEQVFAVCRQSLLA